MLRSKYHRPWRPRAKDSPVLNPFAHSSGAETSFSDDIQQTEDEAHVAAEIHSTDADQLLREGSAGSTSAGTAPAPAAKTRWYERFRDRFSKH